MGPWDPGPGTQIVPDPGPVKCLEGTRTLGTQMTGPECWDPNFWDPSVGTLCPGTQVMGPIKWSEALYGSLGWSHLTGPQRLEALYGSLGWRHLTGP